MAATRNEQPERLYVKIFDINMMSFLAEKAENEQNSKYAFTLDDKIYVLTKESINQLSNLAICFLPREKVHQLFSKKDVNTPGLINQALEHELVNAGKTQNMPIGIKFENTSYFIRAENLQTVYEFASNSEMMHQYLSANSVCRPHQTIKHNNTETKNASSSKASVSSGNADRFFTQPTVNTTSKLVDNIAVPSSPKI